MRSRVTRTPTSAEKPRLLPIPQGDWGSDGRHRNGGSRGEEGNARAAVQPPLSRGTAGWLSLHGARALLHPLRHCLGAALLLQAEESTPNTDAETPLFEAISVYKRDLAEHPNNVWAYTGLQETYHRLQKLGHHHDLEAAEVDQALRVASSKAEVRLGGSCCELSLC